MAKLPIVHKDLRTIFIVRRKGVTEMKALGIVRTLDRLGRLVLPAELRKTMGFGVDEPLEIFVDEDCVILKKYTPTCFFCGSAEKTVKYKDKLVCAECVKNLSSLCELV